MVTIYNLELSLIYSNQAVNISSYYFRMRENPQLSLPRLSLCGCEPGSCRFTWVAGASGEVTVPETHGLSVPSVPRSLGGKQLIAPLLLER